MIIDTRTPPLPGNVKLKVTPMARTAIVTVRKEPYYRRQAIEDGLKRLGYAIRSGAMTHPASREDLLVMWNKKRGAEEQMADTWERCGGTVIVMENGYLQKVDKTMYAISVHGHNGSGWFPVGPEERFSALGFEVKELQHNINGHWLVCGQRGIGSKMMASPPQWGEKTTARLRKQGKPARLRQHPGNFAPKVPLVDDLKGAHRCVIWSSGSGVRALVEGIHVVHEAPHWICANWWEDRSAALNRMAHGQWSVPEIETGEPFARILARLGEAKWA